MPGIFLAAIVFAAIAAVCAAARIPAKTAYAAAREASRRPDDLFPVPGALLAVTAVFGAAALFLTLLSSWNPVAAQDIGIVTSFGQPTGHLGAGAHFTAPWDQVTQMDEAVQITDETFTVRIAGGQTAQATVQLRWKIQPAASDDVFKNYRNSTSGVENGLLTPETNAATNAVLDGYDPLTPLASGAAAGTPGNPSTTQLAAQIETALNTRVSADVDLITIVLKPLVYDKTVQARINAILAQVAQTDVAQQSVKTAQAQARANQIAEASLASNPLVLVQQCFNGLADGKFTLPAGSSCWPGQGSGVVIPSASK